MDWFAVYEIASGRLVSVGTSVADDATLAANGLAKKVFAFDPNDPTKAWNETTQTFDDVPARKVALSLRGFLDRFTEIEREDLFDLILTNKQARGFVEYAKAGNEVDLNDAFVVTAVNRLETAGIIAPGRAAEVLS